MSVLPPYSQKGDGKDRKDSKDSKEPKTEEGCLPGGEPRGSDAAIRDNSSLSRAAGPHSPDPSLPGGERGK